MNDRQRKFAQEYAKNPNATAAALAAGYSPKSARAIGAENLTKPYILDYIKQLQAEAEAARVADLVEVKRFWTATMRDEEQRVEFRLKASELLAKSSGEFVQRVDLTAQLEAQVEEDVVFYIPDNGRPINNKEDTDKNG